MPKFLVPRRSGVHRIAGIALFRTLLRQSRKLPIEPSQIGSIQNVVRNKFKRNARVHSKRLLRKAFDAGYQALTLIDRAVARSTTAKDTLITLLTERTAPHLLRPARTKLPALHPLRRHLPRKQTHSRKGHSIKPQPKGRALDTVTSATSILNVRPRPFMSVSGGVRKVPVLVAASGIPILRYKKPQPPALGAYLRRRVETRQRRVELRHTLGELVQTGAWEDEWDALVGGGGGEGDVGLELADMEMEMDEDNEPSLSTFEGELYNAVGYLDRLLGGELRRNRLVAERMQDIVDKEKELAEAERREMKRRAAAERTDSDHAEL